MLNFHKIKIEYWKVIEGDSFQRVRWVKSVGCDNKNRVFQRDSGLHMGMVKVAKVY